jgi:hypothetical protein
MMKTIKKLILVLFAAAVVWAQNVNDLQVPYTHHGSFSSWAFGVSYMKSSLGGVMREVRDVARSVQPDGSSVVTAEYVGERDRQDDFSGFSAPSVDFKFGFFGGKAVALYLGFAGALYWGEGSFSRENRGVDYSYEPDGVKKNLRYASGAESYKDDAVGAFGSFGLGISVYPFYKWTTELKDLYVDLAWGWDATVAKIKGVSDNTNGFMGFFVRFEVGKDWWVSEDCLMGIGASYTNAFGKDDYGSDGKDHRFNLFFRIMRE